MPYVGDELNCVYAGSTNSAQRSWILDTVDVIGTANNAGYISDAENRGLKAGDSVLVRTYASLADKATRPISIFQCYVDAITAGAADLTDGTVILATDTD